MTTTNKYTTSDIALAAYLKLKGLKLTHCTRADKFVFEFEDPEELAEDMAMEFVNSECRKFDDEMRSLKKIIYSKNG
jgi:hypothetical protein